jgi:hypothetical protein
MIDELLSRVEASVNCRLTELRESPEARSGTPEAQDLFRSVFSTATRRKSVRPGVLND